MSAINVLVESETMKTIFALALTLLVAQAATRIDTSWKRDPIRIVDGKRYDLTAVFKWREATERLSHDRTAARRTGVHAQARLAALAAKERLLAKQAKWASRFFVVLSGPRSALTPAIVNAYTEDEIDAVVRNVPVGTPKFIAAIPVGWVRHEDRMVMLYDYGKPEGKR